MNYENNIDKAVNAVNTAYSVTRKVTYIFMGLFFTVLGAALLVWVINNISGKVRSFDAYEKTTGTVIEMTEVPETEHAGVTYAPVINFEDKSGKTYVHRSNVSADPPQYKIGDKVEIMYDKNNPDEAFVNTFFAKWAGTITLVILPIIILPLGLWMLIRVFRRRKTSFTTADSSNKVNTVSIG